MIKLIAGAVFIISLFFIGTFYNYDGIKYIHQNVLQTSSKKILRTSQASRSNTKISSSVPEDNIYQDKTIQESSQTEEFQHGYQTSPTFNLERKSYFVSGTDRHDLCDQISEDAREKDDDHVELGNIEYTMKYELQVIRNSQGYTVGDFSVVVDSTITVPQWESSGGASDDTKNDWRIFKNSVVSHEEEHQKILEEHATNFVEELNDLGYYSSGESVETAVDAIYDSIWKKLNRAQEDFDESESDRDTFDVFCNNRD